MHISTLLRRGLVLVGVIAHLSTGNLQAFTFTLQEQGGLTGFVNGGGGSVLITPIGTDHWQVIVQDARIGNPINPTFSLAFIEPEPVGGFTAYNNIQVLSVVPGTATFDVLSDEISPYSSVFPNAATALIQNTDVEGIFLKFVDTADSVPEPGSASLLVAGTVLIWL